MNPHHAVQQRTLGVLFVSAMFGRAASTLGFTVAALLVSDMLGASTWAGLSTVAITVGAAGRTTNMQHEHAAAGLAGAGLLYCTVPPPPPSPVRGRVSRSRCVASSLWRSPAARRGGGEAARQRRAGAGVWHCQLGAAGACCDT